MGRIHWGAGRSEAGGGGKKEDEKGRNALVDRLWNPPMWPSAPLCTEFYQLHMYLTISTHTSQTHRQSEGEKCNS